MKTLKSRSIDRLLVILGTLIIGTTLVFEHHGPIELIYRAGFAVCHQIVARTYLFDGRPLPLCARCSGMYLGTVAGMLVLSLRHHGARLTGFPPLRYLVILALFMTAWLIDGLNSFLTLLPGLPLLYEPSNLLRLVTGMGQGLALGVVLYPLGNYALWQQTEERRVLDRPWQFGELILVGAATVALVWFWRSAPWWLWSYVLASAVVATLALVNTILLVLVLHKEGLARRWYQIVPVLLAGLVLGPWRGFLATLLYLAVGFAGLPVFAGGAAGVAVFGKPSIGYLLAFPLGALVAGALARLFVGWTGAKQYLGLFLAGLAGSLVIHAAGIVGMMVVLQLSLPAAFLADLPYWPGDVAKMFAAAAVAVAVHKAFPALLVARRPAVA